jgi:hypothetical protein
MKHLAIISALLASATIHAEETRTFNASLSGAFLDVPHIQQPPHLMHCGPAVVMMAFEGKTGLHLTVQDMLHVSNVVSQSVGDGRKGATAAKVLPVLGMPVETRGFNPTKSKDLSAVLSMAQKGMDGYILPAMKTGGAVLLQINSSASSAHMVFLVGYNPSTNQFTIKNPAHTESYLLSKEELTRKWPCKYKASGSFQLQAYTIKPPKARHSEYVKPADDKRLALDPETLSLIKTHDCAGLEELTKLSARFKWYDLAKFWEPGRNPQTVTGLAQALKLQIAAGLPVLVSSKISEGGGFDLSCVHGYSGAYNDVRGTLTVKSQTGTKEIDNATLVGSCCFREKSVPHLFIGFSNAEQAPSK